MGCTRISASACRQRPQLLPNHLSQEGNTWVVSPHSIYLFSLCLHLFEKKICSWRNNNRYFTINYSTLEMKLKFDYRRHHFRYLTEVGSICTTLSSPMLSSTQNDHYGFLISSRSPSTLCDSNTRPDRDIQDKCRTKVLASCNGSVMELQYNNV